MTEHTTSYYAASANAYEPFPTLDESISCDVCVVGGGYTGLSSALHLAEMGYDVVLLEGARIGFGASGRNGGQLVNSYSRDIDVIEKNYGPDAAKMLGSMMFEGGDIIRERIQRYQIQCDYRPGGLFVAMNLIDSVAGTTIFLAATALPMAIWMMKNFMDSVPVSLEEAAWTDGASAMATLRLIVVPLMRPGIAVVFIFVFIPTWGNFFIPFILLLSPDKLPAAVSIFSFFGQYGAVAYGQLAAFSLLYSLPVLALYVLVSRLGGGSFALAGAVKG